MTKRRHDDDTQAQDDQARMEAEGELAATKPARAETEEESVVRTKAEAEQAAAKAAEEKQRQLVKAAMSKLKATYEQHLQGTGGACTLDRDQAAALYAHVTPVVQA